MPTYEYRCGSCDHGFEIVQSMKDKTKRKCPECGKHKLKRVFGIPFVFAVATGSKSMFIVAIYTYISIWLHYFCTEKEDFKVIYKDN